MGERERDERDRGAVRCEGGAVQHGGAAGSVHERARTGDVAGGGGGGERIDGDADGRGGLRRVGGARGDGGGG